MFDVRPGERRLATDPATLPSDAGVIFIGHVRSPWSERSQCPKNMTEARERGLPAEVVIDPAYREGLEGVARFEAVVLLTWFASAPRDIIVQAPRHVDKPRGVFALRSPARPNPIGLHVARLLGVDEKAGTLSIEAIDVLDGTPLIDLKPWRPGTDEPGRP